MCDSNPPVQPITIQTLRKALLKESVLFKESTLFRLPIIYKEREKIKESNTFLVFKESRLFLDYPREKIIKESNIFLDLLETIISNINNDTDDDTNSIYRIHAKQLLTMFFNYVYILVETEYFLEILDSLYIKAMNQNLVLLIS